MASRADRREKLRQKMQQESTNRNQSGKAFKPILDLSDYDEVNWMSLKK